MSDDCEKCPQCGSSDLIFSSDNEETDDTPLTEAITQEKTPPIKAKVLLMFALIVVGLIIWDFVDPPLWFHFEAQENKKVIMEYAREHFPDSIVVKENYGSTVPFATANKLDYILFEKDGVQFSIWANDGIILGENYLSAKGSQYIKREIIEKFLKPRNIKATCSIYFDGAKPVGSISDYNDRIRIHIAPEYVFGKNDPRELGWLYDFYLYLYEHSELNNILLYVVYPIDKYTSYSATINVSGSLKNESDFYNSFAK